MVIITTVQIGNGEAINRKCEGEEIERGQKARLAESEVLLALDIFTQCFCFCFRRPHECSGKLFNFLLVLHGAFKKFGLSLNCSQRYMIPLYLTVRLVSAVDADREVLCAIRLIRSTEFTFLQKPYACVQIFQFAFNEPKQRQQQQIVGEKCNFFNFVVEKIEVRVPS